MSSSNRRSFLKKLSFAATSIYAIACKLRGVPSSLTSSGSDNTYDFIVVGSGAGGGPLAVNLAKSGKKTLLIEAGSDQGERNIYKIPAFHPLASEDPKMSWDFYVKHFDSDAKDKLDKKYVDGKGILYPRAGTLGGCTAHNAMITVYPNASDWDQMAKDVGDASFNSKIMRKYFNFVEKATYQSSSERLKGWLPTRYASALLVKGDFAIIAMLLAAARSVSSPIKKFKDLVELVLSSDTNSISPERDTSESLALVPLATTDKGRRVGVRDLIMDALKDPRIPLTVKQDCFVTKLIVADEKTVQGDVLITGVECVIGGQFYKAYKDPEEPSNDKMSFYSKEVILSAGTFNTPQILNLSGIGDENDLIKVKERQKANDFKIHLNLPGVGKNLQDRYELGIVHETASPLDLTKNSKFYEHVSDSDFNEWKEKGSGVYTSNGGVVAILKKSSASILNPDLFIFLLPTKFVGYQPGYSKIITSSKYYTTWAILKAHTHNRGGYVKIKDLSPFNPPEINFRYYEDGTDSEGQPLDKNASVNDLEAMVEGIKFVRSIVDNANKSHEIISPIHRAFNKDQLYFNEVLPGPSVVTDPHIREWARQNSWGHHACGTCKMGKKNDLNAVVDSKFKVIGTHGLRIVDASIFPRIPGYFIVSSIYAISEKASDEILSDYGLRKRV